MSKKTLIIIIAILAVVLVAGIVAIFVLPDPVAPNVGEDLVNKEPETEQTGEPVQGTDAAGETVEPDVPAAATDDPTTETEADPQETTGTDTKDPTQQTTKPGSVKPTSPTTPQKPTTPVPTDPEETGPLVPGMEEVDVPDSDEVTYLEYYSMTADEQASFINSFESYEAFFAWHRKAKEEYENDRIEIDGTTPIDLEDILGGN